MPYFYMTHKDTQEIRQFTGWMHNAGGNTCVEFPAGATVPPGFKAVLSEVEDSWGNRTTVALPVDWEIFVLRVRYQCTATHHEWRNLVVYPRVPSDDWYPLGGYECPDGFAVYGHDDHNPVAVRQ